MKRFASTMLSCLFAEVVATSTSGLDLDIQEQFTNADGVSETAYREWEMFEGSLALTQRAIVFKEISSDSDLQITVQGGNKTRQVVRIRRIWQIENQQRNYDDVFENGVEQAKNKFAQYEYENKDADATRGWFAGDIVPFQNCAYVLNMNNHSGTKRYSLQRLMMRVKWDPILVYKRVVTVAETETVFTDTNSDHDIPYYHEQINYWQTKAAFFWFNKGQLFLLHVNQASATTDDSCTLDINDADKTLCLQLAAANDPCAGDDQSDPVLKATNFVRQSYTITGVGTGKANRALSVEIVFDSIFVVFNNAKSKLYRIGGKAYNSLHTSEFFDITSSSYTGISYSASSTLGGSATIDSICSLDFYGLFLGTTTGSKIVRLEIQIKNQDQDYTVDGVTEAYPVAQEDGNGLLDVNTTVYTEMPLTDASETSSNYRLLQAKGHMSRFRPCYLVTEANPTWVRRLTTEIRTFFPDTAPTGTLNTDLYTTNWQRGGAQTLRFNIFQVTPGLADATMTDIDSAASSDEIWGIASAALFDLRGKQEISPKLLLTTDKDGVITLNNNDGTSIGFGEECDYTLTPPIPNLTYDAIAVAKGETDVYPNPSNGSIAKKADSKVVWVGDDEIIDQSGSLVRAEYIAKGYYQCNTSGFLESFSTCGDGVPSNGPISADPAAANYANNNAINANQRSGDLGYEVCDDGNLDDLGYGHACSDDCQTIADGWECLEWGEVCTPRCGNGHVEGSLVTTTDADGNSVTSFGYMMNAANTEQLEECDLGDRNYSLDLADIVVNQANYEAIVFQYPCSNDCKLIEKKFQDDPSGTWSGFTKWDCTINETPTVVPAPANAFKEEFYMTCDYKCGNVVLDLAQGEKCDIGVWPFKTVDKDGWKDKDSNSVASNQSEADSLFSGFEKDDKKNTDMALGCDNNCQPVDDGKNKFVFPTDSYSDKGTDRCGDGIMDGPIKVGTGASEKVIQNNLATPTSTWLGTRQITTYVPYDTVDYSGRMLEEECDNGGDVNHGCDYLCRVVQDWTCTHYYHHIFGVEEPFFTSICTEDASRRRRLSPADFDVHGRMLHHRPRPAPLYQLVDNEHYMRAGKHTLSLDHKDRHNGQVKIVESKDCDACFGFSMLYTRDDYTNPDYFYYQLSTSDSALHTDKVDLTAGTLFGKQRNTFGPFMVVNKDLARLQVMGYAADGTTWTKDIYSSTAEADVELLGAHEFYWWPYKSLLMAKLGDGSSFRFFRLNSQFRDKAASNGGGVMADMVDSPEFRLLQVPGRSMVAPLFWEKLMYIYVSPQDMSVQPKLLTYEWNDLTNMAELKCSKVLTEESSQSLYHDFSMVNLGADGIVFSAQGSDVFTRYRCEDGPSWTEATVSFDNTAGALTNDEGAADDTGVDKAKIVLLQAREDPDSYTSGTAPDIYGLLGSGYLQKFTYAGDTLSFVAPSTQYPQTMGIKGKRQHVDIGKKHFVVLSGAECSPDTSMTNDNASANFLNLATSEWTCRNLDLTASMDKSTEYAWTYDPYT